MRTADADILIVPDLGDSGPDHWQSRWEAKLSTARRVIQEDWNRPDLTAWTARFLEEAARATKPVVVVAHGLGCHLVVHAAAEGAIAIAGAYLVAPPSARALAALGDIAASFLPIPENPLPFPTLVIGSRNDPHADHAEIEALAGAWRAVLVDAGESGHINGDSGHGPWPEGLMRFAGFMKTL